MSRGSCVQMLEQLYHDDLSEFIYTNASPSFYSACQAGLAVSGYFTKLKAVVEALSSPEWRKRQSAGCASDVGAWHTD